MTRTLRVVRIIPLICSIGMGDLGFFGIGEKDYSETFSVRSCFSNGRIFSAYARGYYGRGQWSVGR
jgi:hypothetical protein